MWDAPDMKIAVRSKRSTFSWSAFWSLAFSLSLVLAVGCAGRGDSEIMPLGDAAVDKLPASCSPPQFTYASFGMSFFSRYCNACHNFDQENARLDATAVVDLAVTSDGMPPASPTPSALERMELGIWLACGAP
jgi:hypothetical protein